MAQFELVLQWIVGIGLAVTIVVMAFRHWLANRRFQQSQHSSVTEHYRPYDWAVDAPDFGPFDINARTAESAA